jgi:hypothetical protein
VLGDWSEGGHAACCLLSPAIERVATLVGADALLGRREDVTLLAGVASATLGDLVAPPAEWAPAALAPPEPPGALGARATLVAPPGVAAKDLLAAECARAVTAAERSRVLFERCLTVRARARAAVADSLARRGARAADGSHDRRMVAIAIRRATAG